MICYPFRFPFHLVCKVIYCDHSFGSYCFLGNWGIALCVVGERLGCAAVLLCRMADLVGEGVLFLKFGEMKCQIISYNIVGEIYTLRSLEWTLANSQPAYIHCRRDDFRTIRARALVGEEVKLRLGGLTGLVKSFRSMDEIYCVEVLGWGDAPTLAYCKFDALETSLPGSDEEDEEVDPETSYYGTYLEEFMKQMETSIQGDSMLSQQMGKENALKARREKVVLGGKRVMATLPPPQRPLKRIHMMKGSVTVLNEFLPAEEDAGPVLGLSGRNVLLLGNASKKLSNALQNVEKANVFYNDTKHRVDLVIHESLSTLLKSQRETMFRLIETYEAAGETLRMIKSSVVSKCLARRLLCDWTRVPYTDIGALKVRLRRWYLQRKKMREKRRGQAVGVLEEEEEEDYDSPFANIDIPESRAKQVLTSHGGMILRIMEQLRALKGMGRQKMPPGWKTVQRPRQFGIFKGRVETWYVGPNGGRSNCMRGMLQIIKRTAPKAAGLDLFESPTVQKRMHAELELQGLVGKLESSIATLAKVADTPLHVEEQSSEWMRIWGNLEDLPFATRRKILRSTGRGHRKPLVGSRYGADLQPAVGDAVTLLHVASLGGVVGDTSRFRETGTLAVRLPFGVAHVLAGELSVVTQLSPRPRDRVEIAMGQSSLRGVVQSYNLDHKMYTVRLVDIALADGSHVRMHCQRSAIELFQPLNPSTGTVGEKRKAESPLQ